MSRDEEIWRYIISEKRFFSFSEVKKKFKLHPQQITSALRRLERGGLLLKDIQVEGNKPVNRYLGIDPDDQDLKVTIHDDHGWLWADVGWTKKDGSSFMILGIVLGEITGYITQVENELILKWPKWIAVLADKGKAIYKTFEK